MPELPEVETIKRVIEPQIQGLVIEKVTINRPEIISYPGADEFAGRLVGQTVSHMTRRGKFLIIHLDSDDRIILHLRMTGCLLLTSPGYPAEKHTHLVFSLKNKTQAADTGNCTGESTEVELRFSDTRRFGRFWLLGKDETDTYSGMEKLGIEPLDEILTAEYLNTRLGTRKKAVKECLLDQNIIAGIGNIYADEILFTAGIHPSRPANSLEADEWERLAAAVPERIAYFIEANKITPAEYLETKGQDYRNTPFLQVYGHSGKPCLKCGETLCRIVIGGRSSVYCPVCQRKASC